MAANESPKHSIVPTHTKMNKQETEEFLKKYNIAKTQLPKILANDPAIAHMKLENGDIVMVERKSQTSDTSVYYRVVINA